jgi:TolA-binding protein
MPDDDPLLGFSAEAAPVEPHVAESKADQTAEAKAEIGRTDESVIARVSELERQLERALIEVANLRSDVATLVGAVGDIRKRQADRPQPPAAAPPGTRPSRRSVATVAIVAAMLGLAGWGVLSLAEFDAGEPPPIENTDLAPAIESMAPVAAAGAGPMEVAAVSAVVAERDVPVREPPRDVPERQPPPPPRETAPPSRSGGYVGTLSIDASPAGDVFLNRKSVGRTPVRLEQLRAGSHLVWIERDGYRRWTRVVPVTANNVSRVSAELDPIR